MLSPSVLCCSSPLGAVVARVLIGVAVVVGNHAFYHRGFSPNVIVVRGWSMSSLIVRSLIPLPVGGVSPSSAKEKRRTGLGAVAVYQSVEGPWTKLCGRQLYRSKPSHLIDGPLEIQKIKPFSAMARKTMLTDPAHCKERIHIDGSTIKEKPRRQNYQDINAWPHHPHPPQLSPLKNLTQQFAGSVSLCTGCIVAIFAIAVILGRLQGCNVGGGLNGGAGKAGTR